MKPSADKAILDFVFPEGLPTLEDLEDRYKDRHLPSDAEVTRVGPVHGSPQQLSTRRASLMTHCAFRPESRQLTAALLHPPKDPHR